MPTENSPSQLAFALEWLEAKSSPRDLANLARFGIAANEPFGTSMTTMKVLAKQLGKNRELAAALWKTGRYEARMLACLLDIPAEVTPAQMDRWCKDFDNWAICDTACFHLFDRTPYAFAKVAQWSGKKAEFERRAAFALMASLALHDKKSPDEPFFECLPLIEAAADDDRNFVKKSLVWALRGVGERSRPLYEATVALSQSLASSKAATPRWIGKTALRELNSAAAKKRLAKKTKSEK